MSVLYLGSVIEFRDELKNLRSSLNQLLIAGMQ